MKDTYKCLHCKEDGTVYTSRWTNDYYGTLTCYKCGETEDAADGISKNGARIETYKQYMSPLFDGSSDHRTNRNDPIKKFKNEKPRRNDVSGRFV